MSDINHLSVCINVYIDDVLLNTGHLLDYFGPVSLSFISNQRTRYFSCRSSWAWLMTDSASKRLCADRLLTTAPFPPCSVWPAAIAQSNRPVHVIYIAFKMNMLSGNRTHTLVAGRIYYLSYNLNISFKVGMKLKYTIF